MLFPALPSSPPGHTPLSLGVTPCGMSPLAVGGGLVTAAEVSLSPSSGVAQGSPGLSGRRATGIGHRLSSSAGRRRRPLSLRLPGSADAGAPAGGPAGESGQPGGGGLWRAGFLGASAERLTFQLPPGQMPLVAKPLGLDFSHLPWKEF